MSKCLLCKNEISEQELYPYDLAKGQYISNMDYILQQFGNGNIISGLNIIYEIACRLEHARTKHPKEEWEKRDCQGSWFWLKDEINEVGRAILHETPDRVHDELKDVIAVAVRMLNEEYGE